MLTWILSFFYALGRFSFGLLVHPYQTMQLLAEQKLFGWLAFLPSGLLLTLFVLRKLALPPLLLTLRITAPMPTELISFFYLWLVLFFVYWQVMLIYLLIRFKRIFND